MSSNRLWSANIIHRETITENCMLNDMGSQNKQPEAESKGFKKGNRSRGRPYRLKPEQDVQQQQHLPYEPDKPRKGSARRDVGARLPLISSDSMDRGREYVGRWSEQKTFESGLPGAVPHKIDFSELAEGLSQQVPPDTEHHNFKGSREHNGRRVRLEQKRIVIGHKVEGEDELMRRGTLDEDGGSRSVRLENKRMVISCNMEAQRGPVLHGLLDESSSHFDSSGEYNGRRVPSEQRRGMIGHKVEGEDELMRRGTLDEDGGSRSVRLENKRMVISRNMEAQREPVQHGLLDEGRSHFDGSVEYSGRIGPSEQRRGMIGRKVGGEQDDLRSGSRSTDLSHTSQVSVRTLNNGQRRVRVSLSDG